MKTFILHWLTGDPETAKGNDIADAFRRAGYGGGAISVLDYYEEIKGEPVMAEDPYLYLLL